jgi:hypothetical protein
MSPESPPELTAVQKIAAQKGTTDRATMVAAQGRTALNRHFGLFGLTRQGLQ